MPDEMLVVESGIEHGMACHGDATAERLVLGVQGDPRETRQQA
jgi:hypothetical protein